MSHQEQNHQSDVRGVLERLPQAAAERMATADQLCDAAEIDVPERFVVDNAERASWLVRRVGEARAYARRVQAWYERELQRAEREEQWLLRRFGAELQAWTRAELERRGGRGRSLNLPAGTVGFRLQPARVEVVDEPALLTWCRSNLPIALKITVEASGRDAIALLDWQQAHTPEARLRQQVLRDPLNRHVAETGELPRGGGVQPAMDQFYVR